MKDYIHLLAKSFCKSILRSLNFASCVFFFLFVKHSSAIVRDSSNLATPPPQPFQTAEHQHHIIFIFLLRETCQCPSLCHKKAPVPKGSGQSRVFPARWVHQSVWGWVRRNTHQPLPPYGTLTARCRPLTCVYWKQCAGGRSFFQAQCTHMVFIRRNATGQIHTTLLPSLFQEFSWLQNNCQSNVGWVK